MVEITYQVYIVSHVANQSVGPFYDDNTDEFNISATLPMLEFQEWLEKSIGQYGEIIHGPSQDINNGNITESIICVHQLWPELRNVPKITIRPANGEIFVGADGIFYATENSLINLQGEVLEEYYGNEHGVLIPDLDNDIERRIRRTCRIECNKLGLGGTAISEITPIWIKSVNEIQPCKWTWKWLNEQLIKTTGQYLGQIQNHLTWFAYEQMTASDNQPKSPPTVDGEMILKIYEAILIEEENTLQWLVFANPKYQHWQLLNPELESIRIIEEDEVFSSTSGVFWLHEGEGIWLGEIAGHLVHEYHGMVITDVEQIARDEIIRLLLSRMEQESLVAAEQYAAMVDACHELVAGTNSLELWYRDLDPLFVELKETLMK